MALTPDEPTAASGDTTPALSFGGVADAYERGRPGYPREAASWLTGGAPLSVLELGAGSGKLTEQLVALGHDVHATDPDPAMLDKLAAKLPETRISQASAEQIPAADASYDVVIAAQAYHWFDHDAALPEIARVLKRGGRFSLVWNTRDERIPWVRRFGRLLGSHEQNTGPGVELETSPYFGVIEHKRFKHWQVVDRMSIQDLVLSRSYVATLDQPEREAKLREVLAFYDDFGRGMDGMQLPYVTECYTAVLGIRPPSKNRPVESPAGAFTDGVGAAAPTGGDGPDATVERPAVVDPPTDDDSGVLLIDFR